MQNIILKETNEGVKNIAVKVVANCEFSILESKV